MTHHEHHWRDSERLAAILSHCCHACHRPHIARAFWILLQTAVQRAPGGTPGRFSLRRSISTRVTAHFSLVSSDPRSPAVRRLLITRTSRKATFNTRLRDTFLLTIQCSSSSSSQGPSPKVTIRDRKPFSSKDHVMAPFPPLHHVDREAMSRQPPPNSPISSTSARPPSSAATTQALDHQLLRETLRTPFSSVFQLTQDGTSYMNPSTLRSVPVAKITEDSPYWNPSWESLDAFLAKENEELRLKEQYRTLQRQDPDNKDFQKKGKFYQDNMSKYHKIREIFGPESSYHPNQLVSKHHLPPDGLCHRDIMYRLACKISDLQILHQKGLLTMDPWDFFRWRIHLKVKERQTFPGKTLSESLRSIVYRLCDDYGPQNPYADPIMREAVVFAAKFSGRIASYKRKECSQGQYVQAAVERQNRPKTVTTRRPHSISRAATHQAQLEAAQRARMERRARLRAAQPSTYQGVNAFRAQRRAREQNNSCDLP
ncbi:hypothetical protein HIM_03732 [Hirsutella minnesotensis 3608]|uniref:Uncharacterized protein n=1 Tax=Hirsutella minnesotensis 3608 TaxID=1043627 RepID=A0A0F7ZQ94_9HYPO|nr:hypothetical protein HIM_03732 [Hirsutella minnesotensis 3608]